MRHVLALLAGMAILWLLLSGHYAALTLGLGAVSCVFSAWLCHRLGLINREAVPVELLPRLPGYALWLLGQIALTNVEVAWRLLAGRRAISPAVTGVDVGQLSALGRAIFANAVTLTPGTVTVGLEDRRAIIHSLTRAGTENFDDGPMARRVRWLEGRA